ncbi:hypothetical protein HY003_04165 [Candidatus Saccharibacteria bacterium]|nr:hypothetical protein [Candidatus Saccharibacteria bacterium]MBI3338464.1 hypothetical protein [Candidatus Saccharibacteria bacterium]
MRISLAVPVDPNDITKGVHDDRGVLGMCSNPWKETPPTTSTTTPPTTMPSSTTTMPSPTTTTMPTTVPPTTTTTTTPTTRKPPQSDDCMLNGGSNCPPNGGNQPLQDNGTSGVNVGVPTSEASPTDRPQGDPSGDSGSGDAPPPTGPTDNSDSDQSTTVDNQQPCPLGPGNC